MSNPSEAIPDDDPAAALEAEVDQALAQCDGDARATIRALLVTIRYLDSQARRLGAAVSRGYVRGSIDDPLVRAPWMADGHPGQR
jgi:hypothetical protein